MTKKGFQASQIGGFRNHPLINWAANCCGEVMKFNGWFGSFELSSQQCCGCTLNNQKFARLFPDKKRVGNPRDARKEGPKRFPPDQKFAPSGVSWNRGIPRSSFFMGLSIIKVINQPFLGTPMVNSHRARPRNAMPRSNCCGRWVGLWFVWLGDPPARVVPAGDQLESSPFGGFLKRGVSRNGWFIGEIPVKWMI